MRIIKTAQQAKYEKEKELESCKCPECGYKSNFGCYYTETKGFFNMKSRKVHCITCSNCGCVYEYEDEWR